MGKLLGILRYILRRLLFSLGLILGVSAIIFALINAIGNPIEILLAERPGISTEAIEAMTRYYGLDQPVLTRYGTWLWQHAAAISAPALCTISRSARCCRPGAGRH